MCDLHCVKQGGGELLDMDWGRLNWRVNGKAMPGAEMSFGLVTIAAGQRNPLHSHPNCEEILHVLSGSCDHKLGDEIIRMNPGDTIRIPRGVRHCALALGDQPLQAVISFSSPDRQTVVHE